VGSLSQEGSQEGRFEVEPKLAIAYLLFLVIKLNVCLVLLLHCYAVIIIPRTKHLTIYLLTLPRAPGRDLCYAL